MVCALCQQASNSKIQDEERFFCCFGCRTVWHLLMSKGALVGYRDHPIYQQAIRSGLISNPELKFDAKPLRETKRFLFEIREMWCPSCAEVIEYILRLEKGIGECRIDYATDLASIEYDPCQLSEESIFKVIKSLGYHPVSLDKLLGRPISFSLYLRFFLAAFIALNVMMLAYPLYASTFNHDDEGWALTLAWLSMGLSIPVISYSAWPIYKRFFYSLRTGLYGMESLVVAGTSAAFLLSTVNLFQGNSEVYFDTLTVIVALVLLGKIIEAKGKFTAKEAFYTLARSLPQRARKGGEFVPLREIKAGDTIEVVSGERIPLDGSITRGEAWVSEASMTGEPLPKRVKEGNEVVAGTVVERGHLTIAVSGESGMDRLLAACQINLEHKSHYIRALDPLVRRFVPLILILGALAYIFVSFDAALSVLLISCPCAIGIAAPLVEARLIHAFAKRGAIVRNRAALKKLSQATLFAFDKTGTLTQGVFEVKGLERLPLSAKKALKGLASLSHHPIARTLAEAIVEEKIDFNQVMETEGGGIEGEGAILGSRRYLLSKNIAVPLSSSSTEAFFYFEEQVYHLELIDQLRPGMAETMKHLTKTVILSGDREPSVKRVAEEIGIKNWIAELTPLGKRETIAQWQKKGEKVIFAGDGLNDAPALTQADVGVAAPTSLGMSEAASDILLTTSLTLLPELVGLAQKGNRLIWQNLFWAFIYNLICLPIAAAGGLNPLLSAIAMTVSSLLVVLNSLRLRI